MAIINQSPGSAGSTNDCLPRLDLGPAPRPTAPPYSLLNTPGVVVERGSGRWLNGINLIGYPDETPTLWEDSSEGTFRAKGEGDALPAATFDSFVAYLPVTCSAVGWASMQEEAQTVLEATLSWGVEFALSQGIFGLNNPYLGDANVTILGGAAVAPRVGLAYLEDAIGESGRQGMIHATPSTIAYLGFEALKTDGNIVTPNGTVVVSGGGYIWQSEDAGTGPDGGDPPPAGQSYMFASGPVEVRLGTVDIQDIRTALDRSDNTVTFRAEIPVLVYWDTAVQYAVLVDWTP